ncbi:DUF6301 family protein [Nocardia brasiliensis]|uniref:Uncharacterized protein n=1 Tax=Nocardia brasiliensis (strain ATCC 700358 / HUJEG-1) TaxID=1133849 RepID=K0ESS8_NOCB7|nr:DUF6301 family protein [Nocardia brasiliensis]AFT99879.1 hypothetical protein O3I_009595 [Nocardia brasiliensis ATCC 700358]OCF87390.1 hypothetical protein AW168_25795 [Nocardia brasiliensis]
MTEWRASSDTEVVRLANRLRSLDWSWQMADVPQLAAAFGWNVQTVLPQSVMLDVGLGMASGGIQGRNGQAEIIEIGVAAGAARDAEGQALVRDTFARLASAITEALGSPTSRLPGEIPEIRWADTDFTLQLICFKTTVRLFLVTNTWLAVHDETVALQEQGLI